MMLLTGIYFIISEGLFATTIGKRLLRLRVYRLGEVGPPGLIHAGIRFVVFWVLWIIVYTAPEWGLESLGSTGAVIGGGFSVLGIAILCLQFRGTAKGWRGIHDYAAGTRVVQRPRPPHRPRLISRFANPLDRLQPTKGPMLPIVGSFTISGKLCDLPDGGEVWSGDDRSLGRRILLRLLPPGVNDIEAHDQASETPRPTRLRTIGHGAYGATTTTGNLERRAWMAYVAPAGAPLLDVVSKEAPLAWIDARTVLEQLTDELIAQTEAEEFQPTCIEQVWVEPGGRLQLLDFPLPSGRRGTLKPESTCPAANALDLVRQTAALALEGEPRTTMARLQAPIPPHSTRITDRLFSTDNPMDLPQLKTSLSENLVHAPEMTGASRAAHLTVLTMMLAMPFVFMYSFAGLFSLVMAVTGAGQAENVRYLKSVLANPVHKAELEAQLSTRLNSGSDGEKVLIGKINAAISPEKLPETFAYLDVRYEDRKGREKSLDDTLNRVERFVMTRVLRNIDKEPISGQNSRAYFTSMELLGSRRITPTADQNVIRRAAAVMFGGIIVTMPLIWAVMSLCSGAGCR